MKTPLLCMTLVGCLFGCASAPDFEIEDFVVGIVEHPERVESLTLDRALEIAEERHPDLDALRARADASAGRALQAGLLPNPTLIMDITRMPPIGFSQAIPLGARIPLAKRAERLETQRIEQSLEVERREIRSRVHAAFAKALYFDQAREVRAAAVEIARNGADIARVRLEAGDAAAAELERTTMELALEELELAETESLRAEALIQLRGAIGHPGLAIESLEGVLEGRVEAPTRESITERLPESPYLREVELQARAESARVALAVANAAPDLKIDFLVGFSVALPIFDRNQGGVAEARAQVEVARAEARSRTNEVLRSVDESLERLARAVHSAETLRADVLPRAESVLRSAELRYTDGDLSLSDVLPIRRETTLMRLDHLAALLEAADAWAAVSRYID